MKRKNLWGLILFISVLGLLLAACDALDQEDDFSEPDQPELRLVSADDSSAGQRVVTCWPEGKDNLACDIAEAGAEPAPLRVAQGDTLTLNVEGEKPDLLVITSRETNANGTPLFQAQITPDENSFTLADLPRGNYSLEITAYYTNLAGTEATITELFAVNIGEAVAVQLTDTPSLNATTPAPPVIGGSTTTAPNIGATQTQDRRATRIARNQTATADANATLIHLAGTATLDTTMLTPTLTDLPTELPTDALATEAATDIPTAMPTDVPTEIPTESATDVPTIAVTDVPTLVPTAIEITPTAVETTPPPPTAVSGLASSTPLPTFTPGPPQGTPTRAESILLRVSGIGYVPQGIKECQLNADGTETCIDEAQSAERVRAQIGNAVNVAYLGETPERMTYRFRDSQTFAVSAEGTRPSGNVFLFNVEVPQNGIYVLEIEFSWPDRRLTYFYAVQVR